MSGHLCRTKPAKDRALGKTAVGARGGSGAEAENFATRIAELESAKTTAVEAEDYRRAAAIKDEITALKMSASVVPSASGPAAGGTGKAGDGPAGKRTSAEELEAMLPPLDLKPLDLSHREL